MSTAVAQETVSKLLDFNQKLDIALLVSEIHILECFRVEFTGAGTPRLLVPFSPVLPEPIFFFRLLKITGLPESLVP